MPKALWVTTEPPDRNLGGGSIREAYLLEALARRVETELLLVGHLDDDITRSVLANVTEIDAPTTRQPATRLQRRLDDVRRVAWHRVPAAVVENGPRRRALAPYLAAARGVDYFCVEHDRLGPLVECRRGGRWAITFQNLVSQQKRHTVEIAATSRQRWMFRRELRDAQRFERRMVEAYDLVVVTSPEDAADLPGPSVVVPNGVNLQRFRPTPIPRNADIVFTGTLSWYPNIEGLEWFCAEVFPSVRAALPDARLHIVGREPLPAVHRLAEAPGVCLYADVPSVVPYLERARLAVVPLRIGSGTRLKALEAMASGRPVVGTAIGLAGLGVEAGRHALVADDPRSFAAAVVAIARDGTLAARLADEGVALARRFSWEAVGSRYVDALLGG